MDQLFSIILLTEGGVNVERIILDPIGETKTLTTANAPAILHIFFSMVRILDRTLL